MDPSSEHSQYSRAISVIDASATHYHKKSSETYKVLKGQLQLLLNGKKNVLQKSEECQIKPWTIHSAKGKETWVEVYSEPGWTVDDHMLLGKEEQVYIAPYNSSWQKNQK